MINLYSRDLPRAVAFYSGLGFVETFRTPASGETVHVELKLDGFTLGIATIEAAREHHLLHTIWQSGSLRPSASALLRLINRPPKPTRCPDQLPRILSASGHYQDEQTTGDYKTPAEKNPVVGDLLEKNE